MLRRRYSDSETGVKRAREPDVRVRRISCWGMVSSAAVSMASSERGMIVAAFVLGRRVMVVGMWPPRENVVL